MGTRVIDALVRRGLLDSTLAEVAIRDALMSGLPFDQLVTERKWVDEDVYADVLAEVCGVERLRMSTVIVDPAVAQRVDETWARTTLILPLYEDMDGRDMMTAVVNPESLSRIDGLQFRMGRRVHPRVASRGEMERLFQHVYYGEGLKRTPSAVHGEADPTGPPRHRRLREELILLVQENRQAADAVRTLFELCVEKGILSYEEFKARTGEG